MNPELTAEQQEKIVKLVEQADALLKQAIDPALLPEEQKRFQQIMLKRVKQLSVETSTEQWFTHLGAKEPDDVIKKITQLLCEQLCDNQGQLKEEYRNLLLGGKHKDFVMASMTMMASFYAPDFMGYEIILFMILYVIREGAEQWCSQCDKTDD